MARREPQATGMATRLVSGVCLWLAAAHRAVITSIWWLYFAVSAAEANQPVYSGKTYQNLIKSSYSLGDDEFIASSAALNNAAGLFALKSPRSS